MTSYLRNWLWSGTAASAEPAPGYQGSVPTLETTSPQASDDEADSDAGTEVNVRVQDEDEEEEDDDVAPAFPALNSAQRASGGSSASTAASPSISLSTPALNRGGGGRAAASLGIKGSTSGPRILTDSELMPPPPLPGLAVRTPGVPSGASSRTAGASVSLSVPARAVAGGGLSVPPSTTKPPPKPTKKREKVALAPGHSALDWANLKSSGADLRGVDSLRRVTPSELKQHNKKDDAWSAFYGKVYNITPYMPFHPGGEKDLMRVAGRDGTKLFATTHGWVNADFMLDACLVGFLVSE